MRSLVPLDADTIVASVKKTSRALVLDAGHARFGITGELAAIIGEQAFDYLDAPVARMAAPDVPIPFGRSLEPLAHAAAGNDRGEDPGAGRLSCLREFTQCRPLAHRAMPLVSSHDAKQVSRQAGRVGGAHVEEEHPGSRRPVGRHAACGRADHAQAQFAGAALVLCEQGGAHARGRRRSAADSDGTLKVQTFFGGTLGSFANTYDRVVDQVVDIGFILTAFAAGKIKQQDVAALPFEAENAILASTALWKIYEKGLTAKELDAVKPLGLWTFPNAAIHSREPIRTLDDFKGKKLIASNAIAAKIVAALGATPISFRPDEAYTAIQRGTTDGVLMPFTGMETFKVHEVTKHHLDAALGSDAAMLFMNRQRYESLPAKAKAAIDKHSYLRALARVRREDQRPMGEVAQRS